MYHIAGIITPDEVSENIFYIYRKYFEKCAKM